MALTTEQVLLFLARFDRMAKPLLKRPRQGKPPFAIADEYDVQHLVFAALKPLIEDLTLENPNPKVASIGGRIDVASPRTGLVIEIKATLKEGREKDIVRECFERIEQYSNVPGIKNLVFFVYDPENRIAEPDLLQGDLQRPHLSPDGAETFMVYVVGPGFDKKFPQGQSPSSEVPELVVDEVRYLSQQQAVVVNVSLRGNPAGMRIDSLTLQVGKMTHALALPPPQLKDALKGVLRRPSELAERRSGILYFGPSEAGGAPVKSDSSGLLTCRSGTTLLHTPIHIDAPVRRARSREDAMNVLAAWFDALDRDAQLGLHTFATIDERLHLEDGTAKSFLKEAIAENFIVKREGADSILFEDKPMQVQDVPRIRSFFDGSDY